MGITKIFGTGIILFCTVMLPFDASAFSWAPINPDELKMTRDSKAPGAAALILELQVDRDDIDNKVSVYKRVKILTEDGRKYGDIEIPYEKGADSVRYIEARTILPDGNVIDFDGKIFDKLIVKGKGIRFQAKTLSLPQVVPGAIIECRYVIYFPPAFYNSRWVLRDELFIKHAKYSLIPDSYYGMHGTWPRGLPPGTEPPKEKNGTIRLETHDVPAFVSEDYMPPELELKYRVDFVYNTLRVREDQGPEKYWKEAGKKWSEFADHYMNKKSAMEQVLAKIIVATDSPETKLRKIYAHVQQLRNLSFEKRKTEQEQKRDKVKEIEDVADIEKFGYGDAVELTYLFVALARAAGFQADAAFIATRDKFFFQPSYMNPTQLTSNVAVITLNGKEIFIEPGVPFVPFGLLPWEESGVTGMRLNKEGGTWIKTPLTKPEQAMTARKASFKVEDNGLVGNVTVTYSGLEAIYHRLEERHDDEVARKEYLQDELKRAIPTGSDVTVTNAPDWGGVDTPLVVEYKVKIPGWAAPAGKRTLLPVGLFGNEEKHTFEQEQRIHPISFHYANVVDDDITVDLPTGWQVTSLPKPRDENIALTTFSSSVESTGNALRIKRNLAVNGVYMSEKYYLALREFYQNVRANDEEQVVLSPVTDSNAMKAKK